VLLDVPAEARVPWWRRALAWILRALRLLLWPVRFLWTKATHAKPRKRDRIALASPALDRAGDLYLADAKFRARVKQRLRAAPPAERVRRAEELKRRLIEDFGHRRESVEEEYRARVATLESERVGLQGELTRLQGGELPGGDKLYPSSPSLVDRIWQATFTVAGSRRAGAAGDGLMLSRTQPRSPDAPKASLADIQNPMIDAYLEALLQGRAPRILASRTVFVADDRKETLLLAEIGLARQRARYAAIGRTVFVEGMSVHDQIAAMDIHIGNPDDVIASLRTDSILARATDLTVQSHSIDPPHEFILRSIELVADVVAPELGWVRSGGTATRHVA